MGDDIRFTDGAAYERYMGVWSELVGRAFLDWLAPSPGRRWLDVGCGSGFPYATLRAAMQELGMTTRRPPSPDASRLESLHALWTVAGLEDVAVTRIGVERTFASFEDYWTTILGSPSVGPTIAAATPGERQALARTLRERRPVGADGRITSGAIANAVNGRVVGRMHAAVRET